MTAVESNHPPTPRDPWGPRQREVRGRIWGGLNDRWLQRPRVDNYFVAFAIRVADQVFDVAYEGLVGLAAVSDSLDRIADALERGKEDAA